MFFWRARTGTDILCAMHVEISVKSNVIEKILSTCCKPYPLYMSVACLLGIAISRRGGSPSIDTIVRTI